jgi:preprotein translocase subunit SecA
LNEKQILEKENQLDSLKSRIKPVMGKSFNDEDFEKISKLKDKEFEKIIKSKFDSFRNKRNEALTKEANIELEKRIFLQTVDFLWRSHLQYLEHLRQVVGLRGYAQKDPLEEFKREAFKLFENLLIKIKTDFITFLNNLEIVPRQENKNLEEEKKIKIPKRKMKRNELCFCDSGKKYKHCHGAL